MLQPNSNIQSPWVHTREKVGEKMGYSEVRTKEDRKMQKDRLEKEKRILQRIDEANTQLTEFEAICIITVLENAVEMLNVLSYTNDKPAVHIETTYKSLEERFGKQFQEQPLIDREINAPLDLDTDDAKFRKIQKELVSLEATLVKAVGELSLRGDYESLEEWVLGRVVQAMEEEQVLLRARRNDKALSLVKGDGARQRELLEARRTALELRLAATKDEIFRALLTNTVEVKFIEKWENAKIDQHAYHCKREEDELEENLMKLANQLEEEMQAHRNVMDFLDQDIKRLEEECEEWLQKLKRDSDNINFKIKLVKGTLDELLNTKQETKNLYEEREKLLLEREQEKERRRLEEEMELLRNAMARKIQIWWRAILMRRRLRALKRKGKPKGK